MESRSLERELADSLGASMPARWVMAEADRREREEGKDADHEARAMAKAVAEGLPLQYAIGRWQFRDFEVLVDGRVLIPRPETEQVVEVALQLLAEGPEGAVVDLGTGSGVIAISLALAFPDRLVIATDVSDEALELAAQNAARNSAKVEFRRGSWFEALDPSSRGPFALMVSNPPYVPEEDYEQLDPRLHHEPRQALVAAEGDAGDPGLSELEAILEEAPSWLSPGGAILVEHGEAQGEALAELASWLGYEDVTTHLDLAGAVRATSGRLR
ncbi:MAG: peptide chain release factor N(5)-glutamine methyltransferase [Actinobacteria bacterium]|nr:peptide chain release factor N(5)-glutamine methyltransferase [Actinomycetota bacterium]